MLAAMPTISEPALRPVFQPDEAEPIRALVVAGACGNVGLGKLGQLARLLVKHGVPVIALDPSPAVGEVKQRLRDGFGDRFDAAEVDAILAGITIVQGGIADLPSGVKIGFVFEAIPERLELKHGFYRQVHARDPEAWIASATSGFPSTQLFGELPGKARCAVMHPFFPHLTNKLWEVPTKGATIGAPELKVLRKLLAALGMNVVEVADAPAFAADRLFCGMMLEAVRIHEALGLSPAQVDDACKKLLGTSPFYVHNMIPGANYLSAHCMELCGAEHPTPMFAIPELWQPYVADPQKKWPYEKGQSCPPERLAEVEQRMLGMLITLVADMRQREIAGLDAINFLCENALAFREGIPALVERIGFDRARAFVQGFASTMGDATLASDAVLGQLAPEHAGWKRIYVGTSVHEGVGLISMRRASLSDTFLAELADAHAALVADPQVSAIVIAPDGVRSREFGHGADLQAFVPVLGNEDAALALIRRWKSTLGKLRGGSKPTVAALVGRVLGGGLELAAACDARIGAAGTKLAFPETTVGVIPGLGGCHMVHRFSQESAYGEIDRALLTGGMVAIEDAARWGFVSEVVPVAQLPARSMAFARELATGTRPALREGGLAVKVATEVPGKNAAGVPLSSALRDLLVRTIADANAAELAAGSAIEEQRAAESLAAPAAKVGVTAMLRGKPPVFADPIG